MKRIDDRTVELTQMERSAKVVFERQLDYGHGIPEAVRQVRLVYGKQLSEEFYTWLGE